MALPEDRGTGKQNMGPGLWAGPGLDTVKPP